MENTTIRGMTFSAEEISAIEDELEEVVDFETNSSSDYVLQNDVAVTETHTVIGDRDPDAYARIVSHNDSEDISLYLTERFDVSAEPSILDEVNEIIDETNGYNASKFIAVDTEGKGADDHKVAVGMTKGTQSSGDPIRTLTEEFTLTYVSSNNSFNFYVDDEREDIAATFFFTDE